MLVYCYTWGLFHKTSLPNKPGLFQLVCLIISWFGSKYVRLTEINLAFLVNLFYETAPCCHTFVNKYNLSSHWGLQYCHLSSFKYHYTASEVKGSTFGFINNLSLNTSNTLKPKYFIHSSTAGGMAAFARPKATDPSLPSPRSPESYAT